MTPRVNPVPPESRSFQSVVEKCKPEEWLLACKRFGDDSEPVLLALPENDATVKDHLAAANLPPGQYRVALERRDGVTAAAAARQRHRLKAYGPLASVFKQNGDGRSTPATSTTSSTAAPRAAGRIVADAREPKLSQGQREIEQRKEALELLRIEIEERKLRRELAANEQAQKPAPAAPWWPAVVAACAPLLERVLLSSQRREELFMRALAERSEAPAAADFPPPPPPTPVKETLATLRELLDGVRDLGLGGEQSAAGSIAELVRSLLPALNQPAAAPMPAQRLPAPPPAQRPPRGETMQVRVVQWLLSIHRAAKLDLDPATVADELEHTFGLLPGDLRRVVLEAPSLESLLQGLGRWVPEHVLATLRAAVATQAGVRSWLERFVGAMREPADDDGGGGQGDEPDAGESGENGFAAHVGGGSLLDGPASDE